MAAPGVARPLVGRLEVLDTLRRRRDLARNGRGGLTLVEGNAGVGKSTLIEQLAAEAWTKGLRVVVTRTLALENPPPLHLLRDVIAQAMASPSGEEGDGGPSSGLLGPVPLAASESILIGFAPGKDVRGVRTRDRLLDVVSQPVESADQGKVRLFAQLAEEFLDLARDGPTLVILEDLHLADEASLDALAPIALRLVDRPLWLVITSLPVANLREPQRGLIERILRTSGAETVTLRPFTAGETLDFVRSLAIGQGAAVEDVTRWHSQSGGNPQFLEQLMRTRAPPSTGAAAEPEAPVELAEYLARRLPELDDEARRVLTVGSVLGREFSFDLLLKASEEDEERLTEVVERLVRMGALRSARASTSSSSARTSAPTSTPDSRRPTGASSTSGPARRSRRPAPPTPPPSSRSPATSRSAGSRTGPNCTTGSPPTSPCGRRARASRASTSSGRSRRTGAPARTMRPARWSSSLTSPSSSTGSAS